MYINIMNKDYTNILVIYILYVAIDYQIIKLNRNIWNDFLLDFVPKEHIIDNQIQFRKIYALLGWFSVSIGIYYFLYEHLNTIKDVIFYSFILTIVVYGTFDFTLLTILPNYPIQLALLDIVCGFISITLTSFILMIYKRYFNKK